MLIKILKKILLTLIALSMLILSLVSWRYQGDIHHMKAKIFESNKVYPQDVYNVRWAMSMGSNTIQTSIIAMKKIHFYDIPLQIKNETKVHPSQSIINRAINSQSWKPFIPNSKSSTYKLAQTIWISQNITIEEVMNYNLKNCSYGETFTGVEEASLGYFKKSIKQLNTYEIIILETIAHAPSHLNPTKYPKKLLEKVNHSIKQLQNIFPKGYATLKTLKVLPSFERK